MAKRKKKQEVEEEVEVTETEEVEDEELDEEELDEEVEEDAEEEEEEEGDEEPEAEVSRKQLVACAKDMNNTMGLKPTIKVSKDVSDEDITEKILKEAEEIDPELDQFQQYTLDVLAALGVDVSGLEAAPSKEEAVKNRKDKTQQKKASRGKSKERIAFMAKLIEKGTMKRKEILEKAVEKFKEVSVTTLGTYLSDGGNPKYCQFDALVVKDEEGCLRFLAEGEKAPAKKKPTPKKEKEESKPAPAAAKKKTAGKKKKTAKK